MTGFESNSGFFAALVSIVFINLMLSGDNAVVIALAVKNLPPKTRRWGIVIGSGSAILIRVACTILVAKLLTIQHAKIIGGAAIIWIAINLLDNAESNGASRPAGSLWQAVIVIVIADPSMGIDNMLAVGAAAHGNDLLILFGLCLSIPIIIFTSSWLARLMDQYPVMLTIGAAILGKIAGEMIVSDPLILHYAPPNSGLHYGVILVTTVAVVAAGKCYVYIRS